MSIYLAQQYCSPVDEHTRRFTHEEIAAYIHRLNVAWEVIDDEKIRRIWVFSHFSEAMEFVNEVVKIAETDHHYPNIFIEYTEVTIEIFTRELHGLTENDFILAAKIGGIRINAVADHSE